MPNLIETLRVGRIAACALAAAILLPLIAASASAHSPVAAALSERDRADLHRIETYLSGIHTMQATFEQTDPSGETEDGQFSLSRPGKMRFEYAPPSQLLIVSDGDYVAVNDREMKQVQFYPVSATPVWFLLREAIKLSGDVTVTHFERGDATLRVTAVQTGSGSAGSITLVFADKPLQLVKWTVVDPQRNSTTVAIIDPQYGVILPADMFSLPNRPAAHSRN